MSEPIEITGIAWDHSRAYPPLVATAQRYHELNPACRIRWEIRSLHEFGHMPISELSKRFDLIVIDHPWAGHCFANELVHDLRVLLDPDDFTAMQDQFIGPSFDSYVYDEKLLALPIDAATPAPSFRKDLLKKHDAAVPTTWDDLKALADRGLAVMPGFAPDLFLNYLMLLHVLGADIPLSDGKSMASAEAMQEGIELLKRLAESMPSEIYGWNPIRIAEIMSQEDSFAYCPFAYSYHNYGRPGFAKNRLHYANLVTLNGTPLRSIVGGTGIAISKNCAEINFALDYASYCASGGVQSGIYTHAGGQAAHRAAWEAPLNETLGGGFFQDSRETHEQCLMRPRYDGYVDLQVDAGETLIKCLRDGAAIDATIDKLNQQYRASLPAPGKPRL